MNRLPLRDGDSRQFHARPSLYACSGEVLRQLAAHDQGLACLSGCSSDADSASGNLVEVLAEHHSGATQPVNAVYCRNTVVSARAATAIDFLSEQLGNRARPATPGLPQALSPPRCTQPQLRIGVPGGSTRRKNSTLPGLGLTTTGERAASSSGRSALESV